MSTHTLFTRCAATALLILGVCAGAHAQGASATGQVSAQIVQPLQIVSKTALDFGSILPGSGAGQVIVTPDSKRQATGSVTMEAGGYAAASFVIQGTPGRSYVVNTPDNLTFEVSNASAPGGQTALQVSDFRTFSRAAGKSGHTGALDNRGQDTLFVGGTLTVPADAAPGRYSGVVPITVEYQ